MRKFLANLSVLLAIPAACLLGYALYSMRHTEVRTELIVEPMGEEVNDGREPSTVYAHHRAHLKHGVRHP